MRELIRLNTTKISQDKDYVIIARKALLDSDFISAEKKFNPRAKKSKCVEKQLTPLQVRRFIYILRDRVFSKEDVHGAKEIDAGSNVDCGYSSNDGLF